MPIISCSRSLPALRTQFNTEPTRGLRQHGSGDACRTEFVGNLKLTTYSANDKHLLAPDVCHRALGDFNEHGKYGLLEGETQVLRRDDVSTVFRRRTIWPETLVCRVCFDRS